MKIALLEDEIEQARRMSDLLLKHGHHCEFFERGSLFINAVAQQSHDLLIMDWQLPDMDGIEALREIREKLNIKTPVLFLTQRDTENDIVTALTLGADDYLIKPAREAELMARVSALGRRGMTTEFVNTEEIHGPFIINYKDRTLKLKDKVLPVTDKDFDLAAFMFQHKGQLLSREFLLERVWGISISLNTRTVDTHVSRLRRKIGLKPENGFRIKTVYQHGYRLETIEIG